MLFNTTAFAVFFAVVFVLYWLLRKTRWQNPFLLAASFFFYGWWDWRFLGLLALSIVVDFSCGLGLSRTEDPARRKRWLFLSLATNLGLLGLFKYFDFFASSAAELLGLLGLHASDLTLGLVLPVGISFYTFQTLSYTIDVYRRRIAPIRDPVAFATYVSFFPQLVAGPIERAERLLPQITGQRHLTPAMAFDGSVLVVLGLFEKVVVADNLAFLVDHVYGLPPAALDGATALLGTYGFAFQIYGDFAGYTHIACGVALLLGFRLMENFDAPYLAQSPQDFWRRWHISLSTWLRDYLYIPLGGSRGTRLQSQRNLALTMLLGGLWHGASWTFVVWGAYHGALLAVHRQVRSRARVAWRNPVLVLVFALLMFQLTCVGWLLFRATSLQQAWTMLGALGGGLALDVESRNLAAYVLRFSWAVMALQVAQYFLGHDPLQPDPRTGRARRFLAGVVCAWFILQIIRFGVFDHGQQFIYFQF